jgi:hypothetical protein
MAPATSSMNGNKNKKESHMLEQENVSDLVDDLQQRIDTMQDMGDEELGTFNRLDWIILIVFAIVIPVIAMELAR